MSVVRHCEMALSVADAVSRSSRVLQNLGRDHFCTRLRMVFIFVVWVGGRCLSSFNCHADVTGRGMLIFSSC